MILKIRKGIRNTSRKAKELLEDVDANLVGVVVNGVAERGRASYGYNYGYGYGYGYTGSNKYYESKTEEYERSENGKSVENSDSTRTNGKSNGKSNGQSNGKSKSKSNGSWAGSSNGNDTAPMLDEPGPAINVAEAFRMDEV